MKRQTLITTLTIALPLAFGRAEHPKGMEHPSGSEHPKGTNREHEKESPKQERPVGSKKWTKQMSHEYTRVVESHVKSAPGGFKVPDDKLGKEWRLKLARVHEDRVAHLGNKKFFACADFKSMEKGSKDKVDLDFYATKTDAGWVVDKVLVHKVNGKPRFTYNDKNEIVPAGEAFKTDGI